MPLQVALAHLTIANAKIYFEFRCVHPAPFPSGTDTSPDRPGNIYNCLQYCPIPVKQSLSVQTIVFSI
jgi:hypothetical protein